MEFKILAQPAAAIAKLKLQQGETITCEVGAMIAMSVDLQVETTTRKKGGSGGILKGIKRMFAGESLFLNHFHATADNQTLIIGPRMLGDILHHRLTGGKLIVQGSSWMASDPNVEIDASWRGFGKAIFSGETMFWVTCTGTGDVFLSSFGAIHTIDVDGDFIVDTGHIVAFEDTLDFKIQKASGSWIGSFLGGEGLVCKFSGQGKLYTQSHNPPSFGKLVGPKLKTR